MDTRPRLREVAELRQEFPDSSLADLAAGARTALALGRQPSAAQARRGRRGGGYVPRETPAADGRRLRAGPGAHGRIARLWSATTEDLP